MTFWEFGINMALWRPNEVMKVRCCLSVGGAHVGRTIPSPLPHGYRASPARRGKGVSACRFCVIAVWVWSRPAARAPWVPDRSRG